MGRHSDRRMDPLRRDLQQFLNWKIFQRVINVSRNIPVNEKILDSLTSINPKMFAKQRNNIIYQNQEWIFDDLKNEIMDGEYGIKNILQLEGPFITEYDDFTPLVSFILLYLNFILFFEISKINQNFNIEFDLMQKSISSSNNNHYRSFVNENIDFRTISHNTG